MAGIGRRLRDEEMTDTSRYVVLLFSGISDEETGKTQCNVELEEEQKNDAGKRKYHAARGRLPFDILKYQIHLFQYKYRLLKL